MKKIFFVEDDLSLITGLDFALEKEGYEIVNARTCEEAKKKWNESNYDLVILDVSLPDGVGYDICKDIRKTSNVPIMFLTAADEEINITMGLDIGGDDYITKPFKLSIFISRVNALVRRINRYSSSIQKININDNNTRNSSCKTVIESNGIVLKLIEGEVYKDNKILDLTSCEYKLLRMFMNNPNVVLSQDRILQELWDNNESKDLKTRRII